MRRQGCTACARLVALPSTCIDVISALAVAVRVWRTRPIRTHRHTRPLYARGPRLTLHHSVSRPCWCQSVTVAGTCCLIVLFSALLSAPPVSAQTATYHLHQEVSTTSGLLQLKTAGPDTAATTLQLPDPSFCDSRGSSIPIINLDRRQE